MTQPSALIFDFDGTLVDTLPLHYEAYRDVLRPSTSPRPTSSRTVPGK